MELVYQVALATMCCCTGAAAIHRINLRVRGWPSPFEPQPRDAELLTTAVWMGFLHLLYYLRCWSFVGRLSVTLVKVCVWTRLHFPYMSKINYFTVARISDRTSA